MASQKVPSTSAPFEELTLQVQTPAGKATLVLHRIGRDYEVLNFEVPGRPELEMAFSPHGAGVENLDEDSDAAQTLGLSTKIRYNGVTLGNCEMRANSLEELEHALKRVKVRTFVPEEI